jgi:hypothetical protein
MQTARQAVTPLAHMGLMDTVMRFCFRGMASLGSLVGTDRQLLEIQSERMFRYLGPAHYCPELFGF